MPPTLRLHEIQNLLYLCGSCGRRHPQGVLQVYFRSGALFAVVFFDQVGSSLSNSIQSTGQVATELEWKDGSIDHAKVLGSVDLELGTDNTAVLARKHTGSTNGVVISSVWRKWLLVNVRKQGRS